MAKVVLERDSGWADRLRKYRIVLNGAEIGTIERGGRFEQDVPPGQHALQVRIDWAKTETLSFDAGDADAHFFVRSNLRGWKILLASIYAFMPSQWIVLERRG